MLLWFFVTLFSRHPSWATLAHCLVDSVGSGVAPSLPFIWSPQSSSSPSSPSPSHSFCMMHFMTTLGTLGLLLRVDGWQCVSATCILTCISLTILLEQVLHQELEQLKKMQNWDGRWTCQSGVSVLGLSVMTIWHPVNFVACEMLDIWLVTSQRFMSCMIFSWPGTVVTRVFLLTGKHLTLLAKNGMAFSPQDMNMCWGLWSKSGGWQEGQEDTNP